MRLMIRISLADGAASPRDTAPFHLCLAISGVAQYASAMRQFIRLHKDLGDQRRLWGEVHSGAWVMVSRTQYILCTRSTCTISDITEAHGRYYPPPSTLGSRVSLISRRGCARGTTSSGLTCCLSTVGWLVP